MELQVLYNSKSSARAGIFSSIFFVFGALATQSSANAQSLSPMEKLGQDLFNEEALSLNQNQSCASCHSESSAQSLPTPGFVDLDNVENGTAVSDGSVSGEFGGLNSPSAAYAAFSPAFFWDPAEELFFGGQFWNGRASNLVEQAKGPFLNPVEMAMPSKWSVVERLQQKPQYTSKFKKVFSIQLMDVAQGSPEVEETYDAIAVAIAAYERSAAFNRFDSKFDFEAAGITSYNAAEQRGADLFDGAAQCGLCHTTEPIDGPGSPSLITDFSYDNLGVPANPFLPNPSTDPGLLGNPNLLATRGAPSPIVEVEGRHKVMTLRNIEVTAPYMHNGVFQTLEEVVHFYNTRDVLPTCINPADATNPGFGTTCWPLGEFHSSRNTSELGNLGLSPQDESDIVAYLKTFTDDYPKWGGNSDPNVSSGAASPFVNFPVPNHSSP